MIDLINEMWTDIVVDKEERDRYKGLYLISNIGRVKSLIGKHKILKAGVDKQNYRQVALSCNGKIKQYKAHRLVLLAFDYNNYFEGAEVNHKDENPSNNHLDNLEWCNSKYNCNYGNHCENISNGNLGRKLTLGQRKAESTRMMGKYIGRLNPAFGTHTNGNFIICLNNLVVYPSARQAGMELNCDNSTISKICKGSKKTMCGYKFMYYKNYLEQVNTEITIDNNKSIAL
jgi:hypothetical protein